MGVLKESWCFCNGGGKSERMKASIFSSKGPAMARLISSSSPSPATGFLIHPNLLLTTHAILPSVAAADSAEIRLHNGLSASLFPHRFFITSSVLDLTIVGLDAIDGESSSLTQQPQYLKTFSKPNLDLGSIVYLLGFTEKKELTVGEGKVVIATDNLIKMSTDGVTWNPGLAGFDVHGNLSFMVCDPMKLATSPNSKSSSTSSSSSSSSSWKKDLHMQFGIPIPIICDWLNKHWEGSLDDINKPRLPIIRLMSTGQRSEHSCASFTMRRVFKATEMEIDATTPTSSHLVSKPNDQPASSSSPVANTCEGETLADQCNTAHVQGIPTPEIYESPKLTSVPFRKKENTQIQLLDINFPPRMVKPTVSPNPARKKDPPLQQKLREEERPSERGEAAHIEDAEIASTGSVNGAQSMVQSSSSPVEVTEGQHDYSSEGETTMYSAETAESRNYPSPKEGRFQQVGRSQSCVNYNRWGTGQRNNPVARRPMLEKQRSFMQCRKVYSHGATSQRSNDYFSPTVSSIMKKRNMEQPSKQNNLDQPSRPSRPSAAHSSPKWAF